MIGRMRALALAPVVLLAVACTEPPAPGAAAASVSTSAPDPRPSVEYLNSGAVLPEDLPFSEAVRVGDTLYLSGQIGIVPGTLELVPGGLEAETRRTLDNIEATLQAYGYAMDDVVKCTVMLADISEWPAFNEIYRERFEAPYPARSAFGANGLALGARVEVECIAAAD